MSVKVPSCCTDSNIHVVAGAGLFIGTGTIMAEGGPASVVIAYIVIGIGEFVIPLANMCHKTDEVALYCTMHAMGELVCASASNVWAFLKPRTS